MDVTPTDVDDTGDDGAARDPSAPPPVDVSPRAVPGPNLPRRRRLPAVVALLVVVAVFGFVMVRALGNATMFFYNADEAVAKREALADQRFRLQGTVVDNTVVRTGDGVSFVVAFNGVTVPVNHVGDPPELFQGGIPVVLEGRWAEGDPSGAFASDRIMVKHSETYDEKNPDRIKEANQGGSVTPTSTTVASVP